MKEILKEIFFDKMPASEEEFRELLLERIETPESAAALFVLALNIYLNDAELGISCLNMLCQNEISEKEEAAHFTPIRVKYPEIPRSYLKGSSPDNNYTPDASGYTVCVKLTKELWIRRKARTVYIGCSGTGTWRPITLLRVPPKVIWKKFGIKREYENDPWIVTDYPSLLLRVRK